MKTLICVLCLPLLVSGCATIGAEKPAVRVEHLQVVIRVTWCYPFVIKGDAEVQHDKAESTN